MTGLFGCNASNNKYNYCNQQFDQAASKGDTGTDMSARLQAYGQAQQILETDMPVAPLFYRGRMVLVKPWVQNMVITPKDNYPGLSFLPQIAVSKH
jgi:oligopeptide transport system substrate-binding protein